MKKISLAIFFLVSASFMIVFSACEKNNKKEVVCSEITDMTICSDTDACKVVGDTCEEACNKLNATDCAARDADCVVDGEDCKDKPVVAAEEEEEEDAAEVAKRVEEERINNLGDCNTRSTDDCTKKADCKLDGNTCIDANAETIAEKETREKAALKVQEEAEEATAKNQLGCQQRKTNCDVNNLSTDGKFMCLLDANSNNCAEHATPKFCHGKLEKECTDECEWQSEDLIATGKTVVSKAAKLIGKEVAPGAKICTAKDSSRRCATFGGDKTRCVNAGCTFDKNNKTCKK